MKLYIDIPLIKQEKDSVACGLACLQMIYKYYHKPISYDQLKKDLKLDTIGGYLPQLGNHFLQNNFKTSIITHHPKLVMVDDKDKKSEDLIEQFYEYKNKSISSKQDLKVLDLFIKYMESGGELRAKVPNFDDINRELVNKRPLIALINNSVFYAKQPERPFSDIFHLVVVTGYDDKFTYLNDPHWKFGGKVRYSNQLFLYALYSSTLGDLDNGSLLTIRKNP